MISSTFLTIALTAFFGAASAAPTSQVLATGVIHRVFAGSTTANNGVHFEPQNVVAAPGDLMEFHFLPKNHTFVQSSFEKPCEPLAGGKGIFSGFNFRTDAGEADSVFSFMVQDRNPLWYYCSQTLGDHCQKGMSGVINQNFDSDKTLAKYQEKSKNAVTKQPSANLTASQGGWILPNSPL
ncbi:hypothetical protein ACN47E_004201 [Coniothyrium glycines]